MTRATQETDARILAQPARKKETPVRDPFAVVAMLGNRLERERTGWRDAKALCLIAGGEGGWPAASALADALGLNPEQQENIYRELTEGALDHARAPLAVA